MSTELRRPNEVPWGDWTHSQVTALVNTSVEKYLSEKDKEECFTCPPFIRTVHSQTTGPASLSPEALSRGRSQALLSTPFRYSMLDALFISYLHPIPGQKLEYINTPLRAIES